MISAFASIQRLVRLASAARTAALLAAACMGWNEELHVPPSLTTPNGYYHPAPPLRQPDEPASPLGGARPMGAALTFVSGSMASGAGWWTS